MHAIGDANGTDDIVVAYTVVVAYVVVVSTDFVVVGHVVGSTTVVVVGSTTVVVGSTGFDVVVVSTGFQQRALTARSCWPDTSTISALTPSAFGAALLEARSVLPFVARR